MLDIKFIRDNQDKVRKAIKDRGANPENLEQVLSLDDTRRKLIIQVEAIRSRRNEITGKLKSGPDDKLVSESKELKDQLAKFETELNTVEEEWLHAMRGIPNIPLDGVPVGADETANKVLKQVGKPTKLNFKPKDHVELGEALGIIDIERAVKVSGTRFAYLKNQGVLLEFAILQFALKRLLKEGFEPVMPPMMIKQNITDGLAYWNMGGNENYYLVNDFQKSENGEENPNPLYLIGTGEHSVVPMHKDEILKESDLPKKYAAFSACFRREAGSYGRDTRGILRVHQFDKLEMVEFIRPDQDKEERAKMLKLVESMLKDFDLPYQVVALATGDLGFPSAETIDVETWIPSQNKYRETHSISTTTDFQARRLNIKYQDKNERGFVHILNGTAFAMGRIIVAIMENYQQADGSIRVPKVLQEYMGMDLIKKP